MTHQNVDLMKELGCVSSMFSYFSIGLIHTHNSLKCCVVSVGVSKQCVFLCCICRVDVIELLIHSSDLFVMQVEMDVYTALKKVLLQPFGLSLL